MSIPEGTAEHRAAAATRKGAMVAIAIISDKRTIETDESGQIGRAHV